MKNRLITILTGLVLSAFLAIQPTMANTYGPTAASETLWSIASRVRPTYAVSTQQMMLAIRAKNPQAFNNPNINSLKKGSILKLPTLSEVQRLDRTQALRIARQHNTNWKYPYNIHAKHSTQYPAKPQVKQSVKRHYSKTRLQREINTLRTQLKNEQRHSARLQAQLRTLESSKRNTGKTTGSQEVQRLQVQVTDLKASIDEKNNHIKNLQASLKEASESIKRQYAESQMLYDKLKAADPGSLPPPPPKPDTTPKLTLSGVGDDATAAQQQANKPAVFTDQLSANQQNTSATTAQETAKDTSPPVNEQENLSLKTLLEQQAAQLAQDTAPGLALPVNADPSAANQTQSNDNIPSRLSLIIALISLLFILALIWRAFNQRRAAKAQQKHDTGNPPPAIPEPVEADLKTKADGRQEPDILL